MFKFAGTCTYTQCSCFSTVTLANADLRVKFLKKGLRHTELTLKAMNAFDEWKNDRPNQKKKKAFRAILKELDSYRHEIRNDQVVNIVFIQQLDWWMGWRGD